MATTISDEEIQKAFGEKPFGDHDKRFLIEKCLLCKATGQHDGYTVNSICISLGLISKDRKRLTKKGKWYLFDSVYKRMKEDNHV